MLNDKIEVGANVMLNGNAFKNNRLAWFVPNAASAAKEDRAKVIKCLSGHRYYCDEDINYVSEYLADTANRSEALSMVMEAIAIGNTEAIDKLEADLRDKLAAWRDGGETYRFNCNIEARSLLDRATSLMECLGEALYRDEWWDDDIVEFNQAIFGNDVTLAFKNVTVRRLVEDYIVYACNKHFTGYPMVPSKDTTPKSSYISYDSNKQFKIGARLNKANVGIVIEEYEYGNREDWYDSKNKYGMYYKVAFNGGDGCILAWVNNQYLKKASKANVNRLKKELAVLSKEAA